MAELARQAAVVEPVDPLEGGEFEVVEAPLGALVANQFGLVEPYHRLGRGVVVGVAALTDRVHDAAFGAAFGVADRQVLDAPVAAVHQPVEGSSRR